MKYRGEDFSIQDGDMMFRLPAQPLLDFLDRTGQMDNLPEGQASRWLHGGVDIYKADEWAIRSGTHPFLLWGADFYQMRPGVVLEDA